MRKISCFLALLLTTVCSLGAAAHASVLRTYTQPGYNVTIEYYAETGNMFFQYLHDADNHLIVIGTDNEKCFVYGEWDAVTGNAVQARDGNGGEYVVGVDPAPAASKLYPIPDIVYKAAAERKAAFERYNAPAAQAPDPNGKSYRQVLGIPDSEPGDNRDKWDAAAKGYALHPLLPLNKDELTGVNSKMQKVIIIYVTFEGASKLLHNTVQLHPSYFNDLMFYNKEWRPYLDPRGFSDPTDADEFSYTRLANSNEISHDNVLILSTNKDNFDKGIYHGSTAHFLHYSSNGRYTVEPALDDKGEGGIVEIVMPESWNRAYDITGAGYTYGIPPVPGYNDEEGYANFKVEVMKKVLKKVDMRNFCTFSEAQNLWSADSAQLSLGMVITGYSYELSSEMCFMEDLPGLWSSFGNLPVISGDDVPSSYIGASISFGGIYQMGSHILDESRGTIPGNMSSWPTRPRQFAIFAKELSRNALGPSRNAVMDVYDTAAETRNHSAADLYPIYISGDVYSSGDAGSRIVAGANTLTPAEQADPKNWFPGTRHAAGYGNWAIMGTGDYIGATDEDVSARPGNHDPWAWVDTGRIVVPTILSKDQKGVKLIYGEVIKIEVGAHDPGFIDSNSDKQCFYLTVREDRAYDKGAFDWARANLVALAADMTFAGNSDFHTAEGGLLITHMDTQYSQFSANQNAGWTSQGGSATYGFPAVVVEAHAYPSGIYTSGDAAPEYPDIHEDGGVGLKISKPETQHLLERYIPDLARGEYMGDDVRFNMGDPADLFGNAQKEFVNPRLYSGDSRVTFSGLLSPRSIIEKTADIKMALDRQRRPRGAVVPFALKNIEYHHGTDIEPSHVTFDFEITVKADIILNSDDIVVPPGQNRTLTALVSPDTYPSNSIVWRSGNTSVATVTDDGVVTGVQPGFTAIRAELATDPTAYADCSVYVRIPVSSVSLTPKSLDLEAGDIAEIVATVLPVAADDKTVSWSSSNTSVATVVKSGDFGAVVTAIGNGTALITVTTDDGGFTDICTVKVETRVTGVTLDKDTLLLEVGGKSTLIARVLPPDASNQEVTWSSNNESVATVSDTGEVTGVSIGNAVITVTTVEGGFTANCYVSVVILVTGVTVEPTSMTVKVEEMRALTATVLPHDASNQAVTWSSDNETVARVSASGMVLGVSEGTATITVTTVEGGFKATCEITVPKPDPKPTEPIFPPNKNEVAYLTGIDPDDLEERDNKVYLKQSAAETVARVLFAADSTKIILTHILPVFRGYVSPNGRVAAVSFSIEGRDLFALYPKEINLIGLISGKVGRFFKYVDKTSEYDDERFTIRRDGVIYVGEINPNETYELLVFIKDGGVFDLDGHENSEFISSIFIAAEEDAEITRGGEGGGCSASGYLAFALLAVPFVFRKKR